jgi:N-acetylglucosamine-6-phosphate deacetylase
MKYAIINAKVFNGDNFLDGYAVIIKDEFIKDVIPRSQMPEGLETLDLDGALIAPGFIDLQVNGGGGVLFNDDPSPEGIAEIYEAHKKFGTTYFLPTFITDSRDKIFMAMDAVRVYMAEGKPGVLGMHLEGPFISMAKKGTHNPKAIRRLSDEDIYDIQKMGGGEVIKVLTLAPECVNKEQVCRLKDQGITVSAGHTNATYKQAVQSFEWGISMATHLFNGMSLFGSREPGVTGAVLDSDDIWAGIIVDGFHVDFASVRLAKKLKKQRLVLVTDAMPPVGTEVSEFKLGDLKVFCRDGKCINEEGGLAGSALDMAAAVGNCVRHVGVSLEEALRMASMYPAQAIGMGNRLGRIAQDYEASMVVLDEELKVLGVIAKGKYEKV